MDTATALNPAKAGQDKVFDWETLPVGTYKMVDLSEFPERDDVPKIGTQEKFLELINEGICSFPRKDLDIEHFDGLEADGWRVYWVEKNRAKLTIDLPRFGELGARRGPAWWDLEVPYIIGVENMETGDQYDIECVRRDRIKPHYATWDKWCEYTPDPENLAKVFSYAELSLS